MFRFTRIFFSVAVFASAVSSIAGDLKSSFELESAAVLPQGVGNPRYKNLMMWVDSKFDGSGRPQPLAGKLNKVVTWNEVVASKNDSQEQAQVAGQVLDSGLNLDGSPGRTTGQVKAYVNAQVPVLAFGLSNRLTVAIAVPVMSVQTSTALGFVATAEGDIFVQDVARKMPPKAVEASETLNNAVSSKLKRLGYEPIRDENFTKLGDLKVISKLMLWQRGADSLTLKDEMTFPTGTPPNADKVVDIPTGDGQTDLGETALWDHVFSSSLRTNVYAGFTHQLSDRKFRRLPSTSQDALSADKELLDRQLGDLVVGGASVSYGVADLGMNLGCGYAFQYLGATHYKRGQFNEARYRLLEAESPYQQLHSLSLTLGFSSVEWYRKREFGYPFQANFSYNRPLSGRNVTTNSVYAGELVLFF